LFKQKQNTLYTRFLFPEVKQCMRQCGKTHPPPSHSKVGYANAPQYYSIHKLLILFVIAMTVAVSPRQWGRILT